MGLSHPDTTEYPRNHTFLCFVGDDTSDVPPFVAEITEDVAETGPATIDEILFTILHSASRRLTSKRAKLITEEVVSDDEDTNDSEDEYMDYDAYFEADIALAFLNRDGKIHTKFLQQ